MNIAFFGSPISARILLEKIHKIYPISLVISQKDKPVGRKKLITPTPVSSFAVSHHIPCVKNPTFSQTAHYLTVSAIDLAIVVAYGKIIPQQLLKIPTYGFINVHFSLLPYYRGASPVQSALLDSKTITGISLIHMDEKIDHGPIIYQKKVPIGINDTTQSLMTRLTYSAIDPLLSVIKYIKTYHKLPPFTSQNHKKATYCNKINKKDAFIPFSLIQKTQKHTTKKNILLIHNKIRAFYPWPVAWTILPNKKRCKLLSSVIKNNHLTITKIQIEGKKENTDLKFINATLGNIGK